MVKAIIITIVCAFLGAIAQMLLKRGTSIQNLINPYLAGGLILYAGAMIGYLYALKQAEVSYLYPFLAFSYLFVTILAWLYLNESLTVWKIFGSIGVVFSVWMSTW